jgi:hypothetical protein
MTESAALTGLVLFALVAGLGMLAVLGWQLREARRERLGPGVPTTQEIARLREPSPTPSVLGMRLLEELAELREIKAELRKIAANLPDRKKP